MNKDIRLGADHSDEYNEAADGKEGARDSNGRKGEDLSTFGGVGTFPSLMMNGLFGVRTR